LINVGPWFDIFYTKFVGHVDQKVADKYSSDWPAFFNLGYENQSSIQSMGSIPLVFPFVIVDFILSGILYCCCKNKFKKSFKEKSIVSSTLTLYMETYIECLIVGYISVRYKST
jgi:hypothetical protein